MVMAGGWGVMMRRERLLELSAQIEVLVPGLCCLPSCRLSDAKSGEMLRPLGMAGVRLSRFH